MTEKALTALQSSIEHWEHLSSGDRFANEEPTAKFCALCKAFSQNHCNGCPVKIRTKQRFCDGSPFEDAMYAGINNAGEYRKKKLDSPKFKEAAKKELDFLRSLLP